MKKTASFILIALLGIFLIACGKDTDEINNTEKETAPSDDTSKTIYINENLYNSEYLATRDWYESLTNLCKEKVHNQSEWVDENGKFTIPFDAASFESSVSPYEIFAETSIPMDLIDNIKSEDLLELVKVCTKLIVYSRCFYGSDEQYYDMLTGKCQSADVLQYRIDAKEIVKKDYDDNMNIYNSQSIKFDDPNASLSDEELNTKNSLLSILAYERILLN